MLNSIMDQVEANTDMTMNNGTSNDEASPNPRNEPKAGFLKIGFSLNIQNVYPTFGSWDITVPNLGRFVAVLIRPSFVFTRVWGARSRFSFRHFEYRIDVKR